MGGASGSLPVEPSLAEVRELAREYNVIALRHAFIDDTETPVSAFLKLRGAEGGRDRSPAFLLESAERGQEVGRYSFIGVRPRKVVRWSLGDEPADPVRPRRRRGRAPSPGAVARHAAVRGRRGRLLRL